eukprot:SAG11_NODE_102_length_16709_cov_31.066093_18_plen_89_part_00
MAMGVRATLVGGKGLEANRRCGRSTAGPLGAVEVGSLFPSTLAISRAIFFRHGGLSTWGLIFARPLMATSWTWILISGSNAIVFSVRD